MLHPKKLFAKKMILSFLLLAIGRVVAFSQSINGTTCVVPNVEYIYTFSGTYSPSTTFTWDVNGGTFVGASSGTPLPSVHVKWTSTGTNIHVVTSNPSASANLGVTVAPALQAGAIANPAQTINYNTVPATINCPAATGGGCGTPSYAYQWQQSINNVTFTNISGATSQNLSFSAALTQAMYYKRMVTVNGSTGYSTVATVNVYPQLQSGSISPATQTINYNTNGSALTLTGTSGGTNSYTYQWQVSSDHNTWNNINAATSTSYTPTGLTSSVYYYRVVVTSNGVSVNSNYVTINVNPRVLPGVLTPASINITSGTSPGTIIGSAASGGGCSGSFTYQWQSSTNGTSFTNISGATGLNYTPGNLTSTIYYRRQVTCGTDIQYSNTCQVIVGTSGSTDLNYIRIRDITKPGVTDTTTATNLTDPNDVKQTTQYFDGLGRLIQTVSRQSSPLAKDQVTLTVYDNFGRETLKYLPYAAASTDGNYKPFALQEQNTFNAGQFANEQYYYGQVNYEASPLNRVLNTYPAGINWLGNGRGAANQFLVNSNTDSVQIWNIALSIGSLPVNGGRYAAGQLYKNILTDEQGHQVVEYKDMNGKVILKKVQLSSSPGTAHVGWLCTYYVYDDLDNQRFVIQPRAVELINSNWTITQAIANELCFRYEYDQRKRVIIKKVPGSWEVWMVYDARDRLVMVQDSLQRFSGKWVANEYDSLNRLWRVTLLTNSNNRAYHQNLASNSTTYPNTTGGELVKQLFYDDYTWRFLPLTAVLDSSNIYNSAYFYLTYNAFPAYAQRPRANYQTRGMLTGQKIEMLLTGSGSNYASSIFFYDDRGRLLQRQTTNFSNGKDVVTNQYDFNGKVLRTLLAQQKSGTNAQGHTLSTKITYDSAERVKTITKNIDNAPSDQAITTNSYNELGQLQKKILGNGIDSLVYEYNIRGWLTYINKSYIVDSTKPNYFGLELGYDKAASAATGANYPTGNLQYNGNIAGLVWRSGGDGVGRKYDFTYDNANRLMGADFNQQIGTIFNKSAGINFSVNGLTYDGNGNILTMVQKGWKIGNSINTIDSLQYNYYLNNVSNRLQNVIDKVNDTATRLGDFRSSKTYMTALSNNKTSAAIDYAYDGNGNLITDKNRDISSSITYHIFNSMPKIIPVLGKGTVKYAYDADGNKIAKQIVDSTGGAVKTNLTLYLEGFEYLNDTLQSIVHEEGRIRRAFHKYTNGTTGYAFEYDFFEKDHLGNNRVILTQQKDTASYIATMEAAYRSTEKQLFGNITNTSFSRAAVPGPYPTDNTTSPNDSVAVVNGSGQKLGPYIILKVMAGDSIKLAAKSYYNSKTWTTNSPSFTDALNSLANGIVDITAGAKGSTSDLTANGSPVFAALTSFMAGNNPTPPTNKPKAFLNWVLLDEQLKYVSSQSGAKQVGDYAAGTLGTPGTTMKISKSGYLYIFVNNETQGWDVFFDNLSIEHKSGPLIEETHYYPFGLTMAGISGKALKSVYYENKTRFQGQELQNKEFSDGSGLETYPFKYRMDDPQTGRFWRVDPLADKYPYNSTYAFSENKVTGHVELEGLEAVISPGVYNNSDGLNTLRKAGDKAFNLIGNFLGRALGTVFAPFNMAGSMHAAGNAHNPKEKERLENEAKGYAAETVMGVGGGIVLNKLGGAILGGAAKGENPFTESMSPVAKGDLGESLTKGVLQSQYQGADILEQVQIKMDGASMNADFVVVMDNKIVGVFESKVDGGTLSNGQKLFFNDKDIGTLAGKNAGQFKGTPVDPSTINTAVYRWSSQTGSFMVQ